MKTVILTLFSVLLGATLVQSQEPLAVLSSFNDEAYSYQYSKVLGSDSEGGIYVLSGRSVSAEQRVPYQIVLQKLTKTEIASSEVLLSITTAEVVDPENGFYIYFSRTCVANGKATAAFVYGDQLAGTQSKTRIISVNLETGEHSVTPDFHLADYGVVDFNLGGWCEIIYAQESSTAWTLVGNFTQTPGAVEASRLVLNKSNLAMISFNTIGPYSLIDFHEVPGSGRYAAYGYDWSSGQSTSRPYHMLFNLDFSLDWVAPAIDIVDANWAYAGTMFDASIEVSNKTFRLHSYTEFNTNVLNDKVLDEYMVSSVLAGNATETGVTAAVLGVKKIGATLEDGLLVWIRNTGPSGLKELFIPTGSDAVTDILAVYPITGEEWVIICSKDGKLAYYRVGEQTVGIEQVSTSTIAIFPNPCVDILTVSGFSHEAENITVIDMSGKIVLQQPLQNATEQVQLNVSSLKPSVYILATGNKKTKFIKN